MRPRFGTGTDLVISLSLRMLPRIVLAPAAGAALRRFGARNVAIATIAATGALTVALPFCRDFLLLQAVILAIGGMDVFGIPALLALRSPTIPRGLEMAGNTLFFSADRLAKFAGPMLGGLAETTGTGAAYLGFGAAMLLAAAAIARLPSAASDADAGALPPAHILAVLRDFRAMLRGDAVLVALLISAVPYMITFGGLRPFLFWANAEWFGASAAVWTLLLAAQGVGAIAGTLVSGMFSRAMLRIMSTYELMLATTLLEGLSHVTLLFASSVGAAIVLLVLGGIPEMLSYATYFTCIQERLSPERQATFYSMQQPLLDVALILGVASADVHAEGVLSLGAYWGALCLFSTLPVVALLGLHIRLRGVVPQPRG